MWIKMCRLMAFVVIGVCNISFSVAHLKQGADNALLKNQKHTIVSGIGYGGQSITGIARIIKTLPDCDNVKCGDIIIAHSTDDSWLPSMRRSAGIVTDAGGENSHAALFGKKYGIPVIVGAVNATSKIGDGDVIKLDCLQGFMGHVYIVNQEDLPVKHVAIKYPAAMYQSCVPAVAHEHKKIQNSQSWHYCQYESEHCQEYQVGHKESDKPQYITQEVFKKHLSLFTKDVLSTKSKLWWGRKTGTVEIGAMAKGCDQFSIKCIPIAYDFFPLPDNDIKILIQHLPVKYLDYIEMLIEECSCRPGDMNWVSSVVHKEHVKKIALPDDIKREELMENPSKYKEIIDQQKVDKKERHLLIAAGLFARYWVENKCVV